MPIYPTGLDEANRRLNQAAGFDLDGPGLQLGSPPPSKHNVITSDIPNLQQWAIPEDWTLDIVIWRDAHGCHSEWTSISDVVDYYANTMLNVSVGFVVHEVETHIVLIPHVVMYPHDPSEAIGDMQIPQSAIVQRYTVLQRADTAAQPQTGGNADDSTVVVPLPNSVETSP